MPVLPGVSGCFWDLRQELEITEPGNAREIVGKLWLASLFLHSTGTSITPADTISYLMADDDDGNIENGTPHYQEIANAFGAHSMDAPPLALLTFGFPDGIPDLLAPDGTTSIRVIVESFGADPEPGTGLLHFDDGGGVVDVPMSEGPANEYVATFPVTECGTPVTFYFSAETTVGSTQFFPSGAPSSRLNAVAAIGVDVAFADDFESDTGWTVENIDLTDGPWERGVPANGQRGDPVSDFDGSGNCFVTDNVAGNSDVDGGPTRMISAPLDLTTLVDPVVEYARWFTNDDGDIDRLDIHVSNDGENWELVESVPNETGWSLHTFRVADFVTPTDEVRVRFSATDNPNDSVTEAGIDAVRVISYVCSSDCPEDLDGSGAVDFGDILDILAAWGNSGGPEDLDGSGTVDFGDVLEVLAAWGPCE